ncbi:MAG TPA: archease, partial [Solirubrobacterales bacterium]|nr:archease [Solirubrobacterales bacterium]
MTYRWLEHTSEMELSLSGESAEAVFDEATVALGELLAEGPGEPVERELRVSAQDLPSLLAEWLGELIYLAETDAFIPERVLRVELSEH